DKNKKKNVLICCLWFPYPKSTKKFFIHYIFYCIDHETQEIDILMDWTTQNSPNRNLVLSEISSSASSTTRFSEVMTIETSKKRSPSSSTSSAPERLMP
ncbi:hypothetical protein JTB14_018415, partial [Gonioctena quinquepunctata]